MLSADSRINPQTAQANTPCQPRGRGDCIITGNARQSLSSPEHLSQGVGTPDPRSQLVNLPVQVGGVGPHLSSRRQGRVLKRWSEPQCPLLSPRTSVHCSPAFLECCSERAGRLHIQNICKILLNAEQLNKYRVLRTVPPLSSVVVGLEVNMMGQVPDHWCIPRLPGGGWKLRGKVATTRLSLLQSINASSNHTWISTLPSQPKAGRKVNSWALTNSLRLFS